MSLGVSTVLDHYVRVIGAVFVIVWAICALVFPLVKHMPQGYVPVTVGLALGMLLCFGSVRRFISDSLSRPPTWRFLLLVTLLGLALRLMCFVLFPTSPGSDSANYHGKAVSMAAGQGYGPGAYWPPGIPIILSVWYRLFGPSPVVGYLVGCLISTACVPLAYDLARRCLHPQAARWAAVLVAVFPTLVFTAARTDASSTLVLLTLATADLTLMTADNSRRAWLWAILLGGVMGLGTLVKPVFLLAPLVVVLSWLALGVRLGGLGRFALTIAAMAGAIAPWTIRNSTVFPEFVLVSTNSGIALFNGTNPASNGMYSRAAPMPGEVDELSSCRIRKEYAINWVKQHPAEMAQLAVRKQPYMWGTSSTNIAALINPQLGQRSGAILQNVIKLTVNTAWAALLVPCILGTFRTRVWTNRRMWPLLIFLMFTFGQHFIFEVQSRYHIPVIPALLFVAAAFLAAPQAARVGFDTGDPKVATKSLSQAAEVAEAAE